MDVKIEIDININVEEGEKKGRKKAAGVPKKCPVPKKPRPEPKLKAEKTAKAKSPPNRTPKLKSGPKGKPKAAAAKTPKTLPKTNRKAPKAKTRNVETPRDEASTPQAGTSGFNVQMPSVLDIARPVGALFSQNAGFILDISSSDDEKDDGQKTMDFGDSTLYPENANIDNENDSCPVCLDDPVHPVFLECRHRYCFLCAKGLEEGGDRRCSLCRRPITPGFLKNPALMETRVKKEIDEEATQWFYQSANGRDWWRFEERNSAQLEEYFSAGLKQVDVLICGNIYVIDFSSMVQYRKDGSGRRRGIKRGKQGMENLGVAGLMY